MAHTKDIPPSVKTIADLIEWLADEHHEGVTSGISRKLGASIATAAFWKRGVVLPNLDYLERIADHYDLPFDQVMELWRRSRGRRRRGGALGVLMALGLTLFPGVSDAAAIPSLDPAGVPQIPHPPWRLSARHSGDIMSSCWAWCWAWLAHPVNLLVPASA